MTTLAIKGHATRGNEIIALLEMLGGDNSYNHCCGVFTTRIYFIKDGIIESCDSMHHLEYAQFTLEEFKEKFPYKIGDKVSLIESPEKYYVIVSLIWNGFIIRYDAHGINTSSCLYLYGAEKLQPYKEEKTYPSYMDYDIKQETMEDKSKAPILHSEDYANHTFGYKIPSEYEFIGVKNNEIRIRKKKFNYPCSYLGCCDVLGIKDIITQGCGGYKSDLFTTLQKLLICRDAYWKIAGEEMGLGKPWKPTLHHKETHYAISNVGGKIKYERYGEYNAIFVFPTAVMRDTFHVNFGNLIEKCKELL